MKITATPYDANGVAGTDIILGDDDARDFIIDYAGDLPAKTEEVHFFGADYPEILDHGFKANVRSWRVDREHEDAATAFEFSETHPGEIIGTNFTLTIQDDAGTVYFEAVRQSVKCVSRVGRSSLFAYSFLCGAALTTPPTA